MSKKRSAPPTLLDFFSNPNGRLNKKTKTQNKDRRPESKPATTVYPKEVIIIDSDDDYDTLPVVVSSPEPPSSACVVSSVRTISDRANPSVGHRTGDEHSHSSIDLVALEVIAAGAFGSPSELLCPLLPSSSTTLENNISNTSEASEVSLLAENKSSYANSDEDIIDLSEKWETGDDELHYIDPETKTELEGEDVDIDLTLDEDYIQSLSDGGATSDTCPVCERPLDGLSIEVSFQVRELST